jgi:hypothetical protein
MDYRLGSQSGLRHRRIILVAIQVLGSQSGLRHRRIILVAIQVGLATETILPGVTLLSRIIAHIRARSLLRVFCG